MLYHASSKTGVKADLARREAELEAKKKAFGRKCLRSLSPALSRLTGFNYLQTSKTSNDES